MTNEEKAIINSKIEIYSELQRQIFDVIERHGGIITDDEFDEEFSKDEYDGAVPCSMDSYLLILYPLQQRYLDLLTYMKAAGKIKPSRIGRHIIYEKA